MSKIDTIAVVGACVAERAQYATRLAAVMNRTLFPARRLRLSPDPVDEALALIPWLDPSEGAVIELPALTSIREAIGTLTHEASHCRLTGIVCVVDALHLIDDLRRDTYAARRLPDASGLARATAPSAIEHVAHAMLAVTQIEYASMIVLVNWDGLSTPNLAALMALVSHLNPSARLRLDHGATEAPHGGAAYSPEQERPGWVALLNDEHDPHMTDPRIVALHYEQMRPFHPERLEHLLEHRIETGEFGDLVRSAGFCRLATRPRITAAWDHVGRMLSLDPLAADPAPGDDEELLAIGQDLAFIGIDLRAEALSAALDEAALTDEELAAGPDGWAAYRDPFPAWAEAPDRAE